MISILIATYQWDTEQLVRQLVHEISTKGIQAEIICIDDASGFEQSPSFLGLPFLTYNSLSENIGRSALRNKLARQAKYPLLLFLDADSLPKNEDFISKYVAASKLFDVVCGGTAYYDDPPDDSSEILRWEYGKEREQRKADIRSVHPYHSFTSNNFLIKKSVFEKNPFDQSIREYGHEDTLFGISLKKNNTKIGHIDNAVYHLGLDSGELFIQKTEQAVSNLVKLYKSGRVGEEIRLIRTYLKLKNLGLRFFFRLYFKCIKTSLRKNLLSKYPKLRNLDLLKLGVFCELNS